MPLPWKKGKFSRIVADRIQSAKRGGSLVVETGFPTSLVDLFVRNRDGLKRSSKKKKEKDRKADVERITGEPFPAMRPVFASPARSVSSPETFSQMFTQSPTISRSSSFSSSPAIWRTPPRHSFSGSPIRGIETSSFSAPVSDKADVKGVLIAIIKVFFVVALGLGTKKFVNGLMISAFSLIFMEFAGKYICRLLKPCQHAQISLRHFLEQVLRVTRIKNDQTHPRCSNQIEEEKPRSSFRLSKPNHHHLKPPRGKETSRTMSGSHSFHLKQESEEFLIGGSLSHCRSLNWLSEEMINREEAAQKNHHHHNHHHHHHHRSASSKIKSKIIKMLTPKKKDEIEDPISNSDQKTSNNRSSRLKSKIKKIVIPNRLTKNSKKKQTQTNEQNNNHPPNFPTIEEPIVRYNEEQPCTPPTRVTPTHEEDIEDAAPAEGRTNNPGEKMNNSRGCCFLLLPIILMGLVGGRFFAIALTLAWFSIWKLTAWMLWKSSFSSSS